jgi:hypothetical protein
MSDHTEHRRELLAEAGGGLTTAALAARLGVSRWEIDEQRRRGFLLAVPMPRGEWIFPEAQFAPNGQPLPGLAEVLQAFRIRAEWMQLAMLITPDTDLSDQSALQLLRDQGRSALPAILRAIGRTGEHAS